MTANDNRSAPLEFVTSALTDLTPVELRTVVAAASGLLLRSDTVEQLETVFTNVLIAASPATRMRIIAQTVANRRGFALMDLKGPSTKRAVTRARFEAYARCRAAGKTLPEIAAFFGRHHATVIHGIRQWEKIAAGQVTAMPGKAAA